MLVLTRKNQEVIRIGENVTITVLKIKGNAVQIGIDAPNNIRVVRGELPPKPAREPSPTGAATASLATGGRVPAGVLVANCAS